MKNLMALGLGLLMCMGAAPSRTYTYTAGQVIDPTEVTTNEDNIFSYLQAGVDTYSTGSVNSAAIANGTIANIDIASAAAIDFSKFATLSSGNILVGSAGGVATSVAMSGDVAIAASGATTIQANSVALTTDTTGSYAAGDAEAGNATGLACTTCVDATDIASNAVTGAKIAMTSDAQGDILYYDGTDYARLAAGTSGQFLKTQGAGANPVWSTIGAAVADITTITVNAAGAQLGAFTVPSENGAVMATIYFENIAGTVTITASSGTVKVLWVNSAFTRGTGVITTSATAGINQAVVVVTGVSAGAFTLTGTATTGADRSASCVSLWTQ